MGFGEKEFRTAPICSARHSFPFGLVLYRMNSETGSCSGVSSVCVLCRLPSRPQAKQTMHESAMVSCMVYFNGRPTICECTQATPPNILSLRTKRTLDLASYWGFLSPCAIYTHTRWEPRSLRLSWRAASHSHGPSAKSVGRLQRSYCFLVGNKGIYYIGII